jgi:ferric-dicitrate binding protein FerR (iron transport regulator)
MNREKQTLVPALVLGALLFAGAVYAQETASFREVTGTVEIKAPGSAGWANAAAGDRIEKNTLISTGFKSSAVVLLGNSVIMVQPVTRLSLEEIIRNQGNEQVNLYLHSGRIRAEVNPPAGGSSAFTVRSPTATASVRGTSFEFDTENLRVTEGRVLYSLANGRGTYVAGGGTSYVDETGNSVVSPFAAAAALLSPALPPGSASGSPVGDRSPVIVPIPPPANVGLGFVWD